MTPIKQGKYEFNHESLIAVRNQIGMTQRKMAETLNIPPNTLSRWENGTTVPDAKYLAAFYSIAKEHGITPSFFEIRGKATNCIVGLSGKWYSRFLGAIRTQHYSDRTAKKI